MEHQVPHPYINTKFKNFVEIPVRALKWIINKLKVAEIFKKNIKNPRKSKSSYPIECLLMSGLQIPLFRERSRHHFYQHLGVPNTQLGNIAYLANLKENRFPSTRTVEDVYQLCNPQELQNSLFDLFEGMIKRKLFTNHNSLLSQGRYLLAIDAFCIHTYKDTSQHPCHFCPYCLKRQREDQVWYLHIIVIASLITACGFQFPLYLHRVRKEVTNPPSSDQSFKQECELSSFPLILKAIKKRFPKLKFTLLLDGLYGNGPSITLCEQLKFHYNIVRKASCLTTLNLELEGLQKSSQCHQMIHQLSTKRFQVTQNIQFFNEVNASNRNFNILDLQENCQKKPSKRFAKVNQKQSHWQWIVSSTLNEGNVISQANQARHRWKQEDLGNTLKNRGFNLKHDFSRHPYSQSIWLYLQLIAYAVTSLFLLSEIGVLCRKKYSHTFLMEQMLADLLRYSFNFLFHFSGSTPQLLRFFVTPGAG